MKNTAVIINLNSGTAQKKYEQVQDQLSELDVFEVKDPDDFDATYEKVLKKRPDIIVLAGGDGSIIKGIETLTKRGFDGRFGILPFGTANYLARNLRIPLQPDKALKVIHGGKAHKVPLGVVNGHYFSLMMTVGLTRSLSAHVSDQLKRRIGQLAYIVELVKQSKTHQAFRYEIASPELKKTLTGKSHQLLVYNSDLNQQLKLVPDHELESPTVKLVITKTGKSVAGLYIAFLLHIISFGRIRKYLKVYELERLTIKTWPQQQAGVDGEVIESGDFKITAYAQIARIIRG